MDNIFEMVLSGLGSVIVGQFMGMRRDIKEISQSVKDLNVSIATIINDQKWHKEELKSLKERLDALEHKKEE